MKQAAKQEVRRLAEEAAKKKAEEEAKRIAEEKQKAEEEVKRVAEAKARADFEARKAKAEVRARPSYLRPYRVIGRSARRTLSLGQMLHARGCHA